MIDKYKAKQQGRLQLAQKVRDRQQKLIDLDLKLREFDVDLIKSDQIDQAKGLVSELGIQWEEMKNKLEDKLKFCRQIHRKHHAEVQNYEELEDLFDQSKFGNKVKKSVSKLHGEQTLQEMSIQQSRSEVDQLRVFDKRLDQDLE